MTADPTESDPDAYRVVFENDRVRVLEYQDQPGYRTRPHSHPDSVMYTLSDFTRTLGGGGREVDVTLSAGSVRWLGAQEHYGENTGTSGTHCIFVELKEPATAAPDGRATAPRLGPDGST